jgi:hypothetical protein
MSVVRRLSCEGQGQGSERKVAGRLVELGSDESLTPFFWSLRIQKGIPNKGRPMKLRCKSFVALSVTVLGCSAVLLTPKRLVNRSILSKLSLEGS